MEKLRLILMLGAGVLLGIIVSPDTPCGGGSARANGKAIAIGGSSSDGLVGVVGSGGGGCDGCGGGAGGMHEEPWVLIKTEKRNGMTIDTYGPANGEK